MRQCVCISFVIIQHVELISGNLSHVVLLGLGIAWICGNISHVQFFPWYTSFLLNLDRYVWGTRTVFVWHVTVHDTMRPLNINIGHFRFQGFMRFPFKLAKSLLLWVAWFCLHCINQSQQSEILLCIPQVASRSSLLDFCRFVRAISFPEIILSMLFYEIVFVLHKPSVQILPTCYDPLFLRSDCHICLT